MNKCLLLVHVITVGVLALHMASAQTELPQARIVNLEADGVLVPQITSPRKQKGT